MGAMVDAAHGPAAPRRTAVETLLGYDRLAAVVLLGAVPLVCWLWIAVMSRDMYGSMTGASAWMMTPRWDVRHLLLLWAMWAVMMAGMMLPSVAPAVLLYAASVRPLSRRSAVLRIYALAAGYLAVWTLFSLGATALQRGLSALAVVSPMMIVTTPVAGALLLLLAGLYQLTPLKQSCLHACHSPFSFVVHHWPQGAGGAFQMGLRHGIYCLGCCWALMLLLFVGGVMNLIVIAALTVFVAFEKLSPFGVAGARVSGALLIALAGWMAFHGHTPYA
jgi:predicted metal-binding membrane protein